MPRLCCIKCAGRHLANIQSAAVRESRGTGLPLQLVSMHAFLQGDMSGEPKQADDGKLWTPGAVDFFRIVNEQVSVVEEVSSGEMLLQTGEAVMGIMKEFQVRPCIRCLPMWQVMWRRRYLPKEQQLSRRQSASPAVQLLLQTDLLARSSSLRRTSGMPKACPSIQSVQGLQHCKRAFLNHRRQGRRTCSRR